MADGKEIVDLTLKRLATLEETTRRGFETLNSHVLELAEQNREMLDVLKGMAQNQRNMTDEMSSLRKHLIAGDTRNLQRIQKLESTVSRHERRFSRPQKKSKD